MLALAALLLLAQPMAEPARETRGLWVVRTALASPASVDAAVEQAAEAGFNALLVQVRGRGDAFYRSSLVGRSPLLQGQPDSFDPLERLLHAARARGMQVHAWINVLLAAGFVPLPRDHVLARNPDWAMVPRTAALAALRPAAPILSLVRDAARSDPDVEGFYLSPASPGVGDHLEQVVRELVRGYPLDGLHLDFIRYPGKDFDYSKSALTGFGAVMGSREPFRQALLDPEAYADYRRRTLSALAARLSRAARQERPSLLVSAAVVPDEATALHQKFQDWPAWLAAGTLDAACPMAYTADDRIFREQVARAKSLVGARLLWAGVGAWRLTLDALVERLEVARAAGAAGFVVFSHESLRGADRKRLRDAALRATGSLAGVGAESPR